MKRNSKLQSAMEYLMTYGWAILIIAVVLGALFQLGVFNSSSFAPKAPPGACQVFRPSGPGTTTNINLMGVCTGQLPQYVAQFDGLSGYVNVGGASLNLGTQNFTISGWTKTSGKTTNPLFVKRYWSPNTNPGFQVVTQDNNRLYVYFCDGSALRLTGSSSGIYADGSWHFFAVVFNRQSNAILYKDGAYDSQFSISAQQGSVSSPANLFIGAQSSSSPIPQDYYAGNMANGQIYNASLSANQIASLYNEGMGGAPMKLQNLVGWWPLNGDMKDYSGNNNNGVPTSVTFTSQYGK